MQYTDGYYDIRKTEIAKFRALEGVGQTTAEVLFEHYDTYERAVEQLLGAPNAYLAELGQARTDTIRDALQAAGHTPPCGCDHYEAVVNSQDCDDVFSFCRTCGEVIQS